MYSPKEEHLKVVCKILYYLKATPGKGTLFTKDEELNLEAYRNAHQVGPIKN